MALSDNETEDDGRTELRRLMSLFMQCDCGGPQPSRNNPRADEHARECPYRVEVEGNVDSGQ